MTIFRTNYFAVPTELAQDDNLSFTARGIMAYVFSKPDDWAFNVEDLLHISTSDEADVRLGIVELVKAGYLMIQDDAQ